MVRKILHLDLDAFFCAVEEQHTPELKGKPFAVGGQPDKRGVVASCSYPARVYGIRSAMPMSRAVRLCPDLLIVPNRYGEYSKVSKKVMAILRDTAPLVEQISIDEAFLDVTIRPEYASELARFLQARINTELQLPCSLGVATNKLVAKIANNVGKAEVLKDPAWHGTPPNAIKVVKPGKEASFLAPLPVRELWGVGPKTAEKLAVIGIHTIGDIASLPQDQLTGMLGKHGYALWTRAQGLDTRPVVTERETKSVSKETTFAEDTRNEATLKRTLRKLSDGVGRQLRRSDLRGRTIQIKLRWADFTTLTRQLTLPQPTDSDNVIYAAAETLLEQNWSGGKAVRLIGVGVSGFAASPVQLGLWDQPDDEDQRLLETLDDLRDKYGERSIRRGSSFKPRKE